MKQKSAPQSAFFNLRILIGLVFVLATVFLLFLGSGAFPDAFGRTKELRRNRTTRPQAPNLTPWSVVTQYPVLIEQPAVASDGTFAYSVGGSSNDEITDAFYRYDPIGDTWTVLPPIPEAISSAKAVYVPTTNSIYVFGNFHPTLGDTVHIYNIDTQTWSTGAPMPSGRSFPNVAYYPGTNKIYVIGGFSFNQVTTEDNQTWEYDPVANTWDTSRTPIPVPMAGSATSIVGQFVYLVGAFNNGDASTAHYRYDAVADSWSEMAPAPVPVYEAAGAAVGTQTYLIGGENFLGARNSTYIYDTLTDTWTNGPDTNAEHGRPGGTAIGNRLLAVGGFRTVGIPPDTDVVETSFAEGGPTPTPTPGACPYTITQSTSHTVVLLNSTGCFEPGFHFDNSYWRAFNMQAFAGGESYNVTSISFGVEAAVSVFEGQPVTVRLYTNSGAPFPGGNWREGLLADQTFSVMPQFLNLQTVPFMATVPAGIPELVMEVFTPAGQTDMIIGSNPDPQTGPSYISAADCGFLDPTDLETIFPPMHLVFDVNGSCGAPTPTPTPCPEQYTITEGTDPIIPGTLDTGNHFYNGDTFIPLPFPFQLYNQTFNGVYVNNNGRLDFVTINEPNGHLTSCLPAPPNQGPYDFTIFALWHPLRTDNGFPGCMEEFGSECGIYTSISGSAPNRIFNIEWRAFDRDDPKGEQTAHFEVRLYESSPDKRFDIIYGTHNGVAGFGTAGVQGAAGNFTQDFCNILAPQNVSRTYTSEGCGTPSPTPTGTPTVTPTATTTPTPTATLTPTATPTVTTTPTPTPRPTPRPRLRPTPRPRPTPPPMP